MKTLKRHFTAINTILLLVTLIALFAFVLSFKTVSEIGEVFFPEFGWLFAIMIDVGMVALALVRLLSGLMGQKSLKYASIAGLFAALGASFVLNVVTADGEFNTEWLHYLAHGLPPVVLLALSEMALSIYDASRETAVSPLQQLVSRYQAILSRARSTLAKQRRKYTKLRQEFGKVMSERDKALASRDKLQGELAKLRQEFGKVVSERDKALASRDTAHDELAKLMSSLDTEYIRLATLPERAAYTVQAFAKGRVPNGDFAEKYGVGLTTVDRAMAVMWPKSERAN